MLLLNGERDGEGVGGRGGGIIIKGEEGETKRGEVFSCLPEA